MKLTRVTLTGADDSIEPKKLFSMSEKYPFVEWGILLSRNSKGQKRFPSTAWLMKLKQLDDNFYSHTESLQEINYAGHLCGGFVREILLGDAKCVQEIGPAWRLFQRIQINTHGQKHAYSPVGINAILRRHETKEFIFQFDNVNKEILVHAAEGFENISTLFDLSHGAGVLPSEWPKPIPGIKCGYAGGLSPDNVADQLDKLSCMLGQDDEIWIDMETHLRSDGDRLFDLKKCETVLEICKPFI